MTAPEKDRTDIMKEEVEHYWRAIGRCPFGSVAAAGLGIVRSDVD
jgi:hypothetical protein